MQNPNNKAALIIRKFPPIEQRLIAEIRSQIEFYFTMANLATDRHLKRLIRSDRRGWVRVAELIRFNRLRLLVARAFQKWPSLNEIQHLVGMAVGHSNRVQASKGRVKLRKRLVWERDCWRVLYFEGETLKRELLVEILAMHHVPADSYAIKSGNCWCFVDCWKLSESQVVQLYENLKPVCSQRMIKVLNMHEFGQFEKRYDQLFHTDNDENPKTTVCIPPRQLLNCQEIEVKTRPKAVIQKPPPKQIDYQKIFSKYVKSRNKKTPEAYEKHRAEKIAERRREQEMKRAKRKLEKMEVQQ